MLQLKLLQNNGYISLCCIVYPQCPPFLKGKSCNREKKGVLGPGTSKKWPPRPEKWAMGDSRQEVPCVSWQEYSAEPERLVSLTVMLLGTKHSTDLVLSPWFPQHASMLQCDERGPLTTIQSKLPDNTAPGPHAVCQASLSPTLICPEAGLAPDLSLRPNWQKDHSSDPHLSSFKLKR